MPNDPAERIAAALRWLVSWCDNAGARVPWRIINEIEDALSDFEEAGQRAEMWELIERTRRREAAQ